MYDISKPANLFIASVYISAIITDPKVPPMHPSIDFLGLISVNLCFPNLLPTKYAHVSVPQAAIRINQIKYLPFSIPCNSGINDKKNVI